MTRSLAALLLVPLAVVTAHAEVGPAGGEFRVNTYTTGVQQSTTRGICRDDRGNTVILWHDIDEDSSGVFGRRYGSDGSALDDPFRVNAYTTGAQFDPAVACAPNGDWVAVWTSPNPNDTQGIAGRRFTSAGTPIGGDFVVNTYTTGLQEAASIDLDGMGRFVVVWSSAGVDPGSAGIAGQRYAADGTPAGGQFRANTYTTGNQLRGAVAMNDDGAFLVVWAGPGGGDPSGVFAQTYSSAGVPEGGEFRVNSYTSGTESDPDVATMPDGGWLVAWHGNDQDNVGIFVKRYASDGTASGGEFQANAYTTGQQASPTIAAGNDGHFVLSWSSPTPGGDSEDIMVRRFGADAVPVAPEFRVNTYTLSLQSRHAVATDRDGDFVVAWTSYYQDGDATGVFAQRFADPCGDGTVGAGEACDDGSRVDGPCCSATCAVLAAGAVCDSDAVDCTVDACDGAGACGHTVADTGCPACRRCDASEGCIARARTDCRRPTRARAASLQLTNKPTDGKDRLAFLWQRGAATATADFGALPAAPDYTLCLFDQTGLLLDATLPAASWKKRGKKSFTYRSRRGTPDGVTSAVLQSGAAGKARASVAGKGAALGLPAFPLAPPVHAQLQAGGNDGACFASDFATPKKNTATLFKATGE
jgi:cysteine-rich repeat protein